MQSPTEKVRQPIHEQQSGPRVWLPDHTDTSSSLNIHFNKNENTLRHVQYFSTIFFWTLDAANALYFPLGPLARPQTRITSCKWHRQQTKSRTRDSGTGSGVSGGTHVHTAQDVYVYVYMYTCIVPFFPHILLIWRLPKKKKKRNTYE